MEANEFEHLTSAENLTLQNFRQISSDSEKAIFLINLQDITLIVKLAEFDKQVETVCKSECMKEFWEAVWSLAGRFPTYQEADENSALTYQSLKPQPKISCFNLIRGMHFYNLELFQKSWFYMCFEAYKKLTDFLCKNLFEAGTEKEVKYQDALNMLDFFSRVHGTPGYLLLAYLSYYIYCYHRGRDEKGLAELHRQQILYYLYLAEYCKPDSEASIHNAYYGRGLSYSTPFKIDSIPKMRENFLEMVTVKTSDLDRARGRAKQTFEEFHQPKPAVETPTPTL